MWAIQTAIVVIAACGPGMLWYLGAKILKHEDCPICNQV